MHRQIILQEAINIKDIFTGICLITAASNQLSHSNDERNLVATCQIATRPDLHTWLKRCPFRKGRLNIYNLVWRDFEKFLLSLSILAIHAMIQNLTLR